MAKVTNESKGFSVWLGVIITILLTILFLISVPSVIFLTIYFPWNNHFPSQSEKEFKNSCINLNGKEFNYENLSKIDGYTRMLERISEEEIKDSLQKKNSIVIYKGENFQEGWYCAVYSKDGFIISKTDYYIDYHQ